MFIKPLNYDSTNREFRNFYQEFLRNHNNLKNQKVDDPNTSYPRSLRLLRIRLRLIIGLEFRFNTEYSLVKSKYVEKAYKCILRTNKAWFAIEALIEHCVYEKIITQTGMTRRYSTYSNNLDMTETLRNVNNLLNEKLWSKPNRKKYVDNYLIFLSNNAKTELRNSLSKTITKINHEKDFESEDLLSIAYGTRNIFIHQGESAFSGTENYTSKIILLMIVYDFLILFNLKATNNLYRQRLPQ